MHDRTALGNADITDAQLALIVADSLGVERVDLLCSRPTSRRTTSRP